MTRRSPLIILALLFLTLPLTGCFYSREIAHTRRDIEEAYPEAHFDRTVVVSLGPLSLRTVGWISSLVPEDEARMAADYLREMRRIKVGVYETQYLPSLDEVDLAHLRRFEKADWEVAVRARENDEMVWVLYREHYDTVRDMYALVLTRDELILARIQGNLNRLLSRVMEDHAGFTRLVQRAEL